MNRKQSVRLFVGAAWWLTSAALTASAGAAGALSPPDNTVAITDTVVRIEARDGRFIVTSLRSKQTGWDWGARGGAQIRLIRSVRSQGHELSLNWRLAGEEAVKGPTNRLIYRFTNATPRLELRSVWTAASGPGPVEHAITIKNLSDSEIVLPLQTSLVFPASAPAGHTLENWWVEKGGGTPTDIGTHHAGIDASFRASLVSVPYSYDDPKLRDPIPWTTVQDMQGRQGWYAGIEFSGRTRIALQALPGHPNALVTELGLDPGDGAVPYSTRLAPGETFTAPTAFVGCYAGDVDDGANRLHRWAEAHVRPPSHDPRFPLLVNNSWGSGMAVDESLARTMIDDAAALGLELFHIDAGWFTGVGDWVPSLQKFPHGLAPV